MLSKSTIEHHHTGGCMQLQTREVHVVDLMSISRISFVVGTPATFHNSNDALRCDSRYWSTKARGDSHRSELAVCLCHHPSKTPGTLGLRPTLRSQPKVLWEASSDDGKLTEVERECQCVRDSVTIVPSHRCGGPRLLATLGIPSPRCWSGHLHHHGEPDATIRR